MRIITLPVGELDTNCYLVFEENRRDAVVIDPGDEAEKIVDALGGKTVAAVLLTHGHYDHTGALSAFKDAPIYIHELDAPMLQSNRLSFGYAEEDHGERPQATGFVREGQRLELAGISFEVLHTPGHTRGSVCYKAGEDIFTGDTLFKGDYGRTDLPGGSEEQMRASLRRLFTFHGHRIYPGHYEGDTLK